MKELELYLSDHRGASFLTSETRNKAKKLAGLLINQMLSPKN